MSEGLKLKFQAQKIPGVYIFESELFTDNRGIYRRHFCKEALEAQGLTADICQGNVAENEHRHTLRGFHYQLPPFEETKIFSCLAGALYDIVVDLRKKSPTFLQWIHCELTQENRKSLYVPQGCANAFLTLKDGTIVHYYSSQFYNSKAEQGIRYNDPSFHFQWPAEPKFISEKDLIYPDFAVSIPKRKS